MNQHDIRLIDKDDPKTPTAIIKEIKKATTDADDKYETFVVTHDPINLKSKLTLKKRAAALQSAAETNGDSEIIDEDYKDQDADGLGL